ncbi:splicing factor, arginine/serine-rich 18 [Sarotherodon galilaeus]
MRSLFYSSRRVSTLASPYLDLLCLPACSPACPPTSTLHLETLQMLSTDLSPLPSVMLTWTGTNIPSAL